MVRRRAVVVVTDVEERRHGGNPGQAVAGGHWFVVLRPDGEARESRNFTDSG